MEDYEYYHASLEEDPHLPPSLPRAPRFVREMLYNYIHEKNYSRQKLEYLLANALFVLEERNLREKYA